MGETPQDIKEIEPQPEGENERRALLGQTFEREDQLEQHLVEALRKLEAMQPALDKANMQVEAYQIDREVARR